MRLTNFTDYSLRVLIYLAAQPGRRATIAEIAKRFGIAENHLMKVVHFLGKAGWLSTVRGPSGGIELATAPQQIRIGSVVRSTEGAPVLAECFEDDGNCAIYDICRLRGVFDEALTAFFAVLDRYTLDDLTANRRELTRILFPIPATSRDQ
ncbi:MAG TPA: Rrf2 family transcriptional regulator [Ramlibacter sp.]|uniref:RrF2 family transcriptional regulator n=1 Tax=Ramlibacter sp. TaxID=1917967 RepID=UPI002CDA5FE5|nr:Rrf2 family transcriptional regulator [Ramlibacter sp.]HVZ42971.1 Rrf2 family transcriptional regulator [Ramlibacter sp.]